MKEERRILTLDNYDHGMVVTALNDKRNIMLNEKKSTEVVDEVLLKVIDAPSRKVRIKGVPEKSNDFLGEGGATEQTNFCRYYGKMSTRSPRRRDDEAR